VATSEGFRIVEVEEPRAVVELECAQREGLAVAKEVRRLDRRPRQAGELLDERRHRLEGRVEAPVESWSVVSPLTLEHAGKPECSSAGSLRD
jgi:hypothetical protein